LVILGGSLHEVVISLLCAVECGAKISFTFIFVFVEKGLKRLSVILGLTVSVESVNITEIRCHGIIAHEVVLQSLIAAL
jgi:hypothetical protein